MTNKVLIFTAIASVATAFSAACAEQPTTAAESEVRLSEVVVTAQRRTENLQSVPVAVTALSADDLAASGIAGTLDLPQAVPGLTMPQSNGYVMPHIRGVGTSAFGAGLENSVATYVDGVYLANAPAAILQFKDVERVEVLKGPQGTLFGRNATGGLIQIQTKDPSHDFGGSASVGFGNYRTTTASGMVSGGLGSAVAADLSVQASFQGEGYGTNLFNGRDVYKDTRNISARTKWLIQPDERMSLRVALDYAIDQGSQFQTSHSAPGTVPAFGPAFTASPWDINSDFQPFNDYKGGGISARLDYEFDALQLVNIAAYRKSRFELGFDGDLTPNPFETISPILDRESQFSEELQLLSKGQSNLQWVAGVYFFHADGGYSPSQVNLGGPMQIPLGPPPAPSLSIIQISGHQLTNSIAGYAQATAKVAESTRLVGGVRFTHEKRTMNADEEGFIAPGVSIGPLIPSIRDASKTFSSPSWRLALERQFTDAVMGYVSYNRGFKSGGFNVGVPTDAPFEPEKLDAFEVGVKADAVDHRVRVNSAVYFYNYKDIQVSHFVLGQIGYYNGAKAHLYGFDTDIEAKVAKNLLIRAGLSINHSEFTSFLNALIATPLPTGGSAITTGDAHGNELPFAPKTTASVTLNYRLPTSSGAYEFSATDAYTSSWFAAPDNVLQNPAKNLVNASLAWTSPSDRYTVELWGRNLTNEAVAATINASAISSLIQYQWPRTYGATASVKF